MSKNAAMQQPVRKKKKGGCRGLFILILLLAVLVAGGGWYTMGLRAVEPGSTEEVVVEIPNGSGASMIVEILDEFLEIKNETDDKTLGGTSIIDM